VNVAEHYIYNVKKDTPFRVYPIGDLHWELKTAQRKKAKEYIKHIQNDPMGVAIFMGDMTDAREKTHKFFKSSMIDSKYAIEDLDSMQTILADELADVVAPIADKTLGFITGNHHQSEFTDTLRRFVKQRSNVDIPNLGNRAMIRMKGVREDTNNAGWTYVIFAVHRDSTGKKPGAQYNNQADVQGWVEADLYLYAHSHRPSQQALPLVYMPTKGALKYITRRLQHINAGCFVDSLSTNDSYADDKNLPPQLNIHFYAQAKYTG
jgi:hypothetical protein